ncbi:MAG: hypothetical protein EON98_12705 [Chitinophagaceae bacterium]|nr:MAG: hypothetical protein EON98_12705 [Chitinophagaceae bacterium]
MAKPSLGSLLLAGAAAYGIYKVSKMSAQERNDLVNKGKKLVNDNLGGLKEKFGANGSTPAARETYANDVSYGG